jgi:site-specific recombinase XerD
MNSHIAQQTFVTNGISIEGVCKMLEHKSIRMTQHYAKVIDRKVSDDMAILKQKLSRQPLAKSS